MGHEIVIKGGEIDAQGQVVSPGFVDLHCHLNAQVGWDPALTPVSWHGVTSVLMGNCGVTFAPCKPTDQELLAGMMETVEDIPKNAILTGLPWDWEDYGGYLDTVERLEPSINVAGLVGHCAVRFYVMGERAVEEQATEDEIKTMADIVAASIDKGAMGFSTNRYPPHKLPDGRSIPGTFADPKELHEIAKVVGPRNGVIQAAGADVLSAIDIFQAITDTTPVRVLFNVGIGPEEVAGSALAARLAEFSQGRDTTAITQVRGSGIIFGLQSMVPFQGETWDKIRKLDLAGRLKAINHADTAAKLIAEIDEHENRFPLKRVFYLGSGEMPDYTVPSDQHVKAQADAAVETWGQHFIRLSRETNGLALFNLRMSNPNLKELGDLLKSDHCFPSLGDAGAHVSMMVDAGWPSFILSHWVRESGVYSLAKGIRRITSASARVIGLNDRGVLKEGFRADVNVFDPATVVELQPRLVHDFPGGAPRYIQKSRGYKATTVNGEINMEDGEHTGALSGTVLRHGP